MALTDRLRAEVYARDKGICSFSGVSLWVLDYVNSGLARRLAGSREAKIARGKRHVENSRLCLGVSQFQEEGERRG